ncbi:hypothetical protein HFK89_24710 [Ralstonia pseudosolanacearum]|uniref:T6SS immunity protein Tli3 family protein n=1 Tax=Ralstonia pseudosolanacearum TaxID=1310165 RepID=UPI0011137A79|nr:hypothetical protein [Ralstonia pseudosolanacearum]MCK4165547.1 hypothetical protein [Ralstonia pseudosolanacearum]
MRLQRSAVWAVAVVVSTMLYGCAQILMPVGAGFGAGRISTGPQLPDTDPERFIYRIDDHRFLTAQADSTCQDSRIFYYDTRLGIRTLAAGNYGGGSRAFFQGYYAIDSDQYIAIPALGFSDYSGDLFYIRYSTDGGRTFKTFRAGGDEENTSVIVKGHLLYVTSYWKRPDSRMMHVYDLTKDPQLDESKDPHGNFERYVPRVDVSRTVSFDTTSPSGQTKWVCGDPIKPQMSDSTQVH